MPTARTTMKCNEWDRVAKVAKYLLVCKAGLLKGGYAEGNPAISGVGWQSGWIRLLLASHLIYKRHCECLC